MMIQGLLSLVLCSTNYFNTVRKLKGNIFPVYTLKLIDEHEKVRLLSMAKRYLPNLSGTINLTANKLPISPTSSIKNVMQH